MLPYFLKCLYYEHDRSYFEHVFMKIIANIKDSTDKKNILRILSDINNGIFYSQRKISKQLGISVGLSNLYVKRCLKKGWIKLKTVPKLSKTQSLGDHPVVKKYFADCKRKLRQGGLETKGTKAIIVLLSKMLSFTEAEIDILKEAIAEN